MLRLRPCVWQAVSHPSQPASPPAQPARFIATGKANTPKALFQRYNFLPPSFTSLLSCLLALRFIFHSCIFFSFSFLRYFFRFSLRLSYSFPCVLLNFSSATFFCVYLFPSTFFYHIRSYFFVFFNYYFTRIAYFLFLFFFFFLLFFPFFYPFYYRLILLPPSRTPFFLLLSHFSAHLLFHFYFLPSFLPSFIFYPFLLTFFHHVFLLSLPCLSFLHVSSSSFISLTPLFLFPSRMSSLISLPLSPLLIPLRQSFLQLYSPFFNSYLCLLLTRLSFIPSCVLPSLGLIRLLQLCVSLKGSFIMGTYS